MMYKSAREMQDLELSLRSYPEFATRVPHLSIGKMSPHMSYERIREKEVYVMNFIAAILGDPALLKNPETIAFFGLSRFYGKIGRM